MKNNEEEYNIWTLCTDIVGRNTLPGNFNIVSDFNGVAADYVHILTKNEYEEAINTLDSAMIENKKYPITQQVFSEKNTKELMVNICLIGLNNKIKSLENKIGKIL